MKQILRLAIAVCVPLVLVSSGGCGGGLTQKDMMRHARRRSPAEDDEPDGANVTGQQAPAREIALPLPAATKPVAATPAPAPASSGTEGSMQPAASNQATVATSASKASITRSADPHVTNPEVDRELLQVSRDAGKSLSPEAGRRQAIVKMQRIGKALEAYCQEKGHYPAAAIYGARKESLLSWRVALLPYLGHTRLYQQFRREEPWNSKHNQALLAEIPPVYVLLEGVTPGGAIGQTNFLLPVGAGAAFAGRSGPVPRFIEDGAENTVILVESDPAHAVPWTAPEDYQVNLRAPTLGLGTLRDGGFLVVWGGGTVNWIDVNTPQHLLQTIYTTDSGDGVTAVEVGRDPFAEPVPSDPNTSPVAEPLVSTVTDETKPAIARNRTDATRNDQPLAQPRDPDVISPTVALRYPVPSDQALTESKKLLRDLYQEEYKAAVTQQTRQTLVKRMLEQLNHLDADIAGQYALLDTVRQISGQTGAVEPALKAADELSTRFDIDSHAIKLDTLVGLSRSAAAQQAQTIVQAGTQACQQAFLAERYDVADQLCGIALAASQKMRNMGQATTLQRLRQKVQAAARSHRLAERAMSTLDENPDDRRACTMLGKYLCLVRQDWSNGLPILARGDNSQLAPLAKSELDQPARAEEQVNLGDAWWQVAEQANVAERSSMLVRAAYWYRLATPVLPAGLARVKIEHRLRQIEQSLGVDAVGASHDGDTNVATGSENSAGQLW